MAKERTRIDKKYKWDLSAIYKSPEEFERDYKLADEKITALGAYENIITESCENLLLALRELYEIELIIEKLWQYASLSFATDTTDNYYQALTSRVKNLAVAADNASSFVKPRILKNGEEATRKMISELPELKKYSRKIEKILRERPHTLSDKEEALLSEMGNCLDTHEEIRSILSNSDLRFGRIRNEDSKLAEITDSNYVLYLMSHNRGVRRSAFRCAYKTYEQFANTYATLYESKVKEAVTLAKIRNYTDSLSASVFRDEVTSEIYNNLIETVSSGLSPLFEYYELKREILGLKKLHLYDVYTPLIKNASSIYTYEMAVDEVLKSVQPLGEEYQQVLKSGLCEKGWVDVFSSRGKRSGAFSSSTPVTEPYILINFNGNYSDVSTLAHEAGHSMHSWYSKENNEHWNSQYTIFVAEVASTVNELLLAKRKLRESENDGERLYILNQLMETYKGTLYRQTMFAEFERDTHALCGKGSPLTAEVLNENYYKLVKKYFGNRVVCDKQIAFEWMRIPHFYSCFYVYKYATAISAATAIVKRIEINGAPYIKKYIDFLKCGDSKTPLQSLAVADIDMADPKIIEAAIVEFDEIVKQFKNLYFKQNGRL